MNLSKRFSKLFDLELTVIVDNFVSKWFAPLGAAHLDLTDLCLCELSLP